MRELSQHKGRLGFCFLCCNNFSLQRMNAKHTKFSLFSLFNVRSVNGLYTTWELQHFCVSLHLVCLSVKAVCSIFDFFFGYIKLAFLFFFFANSVSVCLSKKTGFPRNLKFFQEIYHLFFKLLFLKMLKIIMLNF